MVLCTSLSPPAPSSNLDAAHCVDLVEEDEAGLLGAGHLEQLPDHTSQLAHVLLDKLGPNHPGREGTGTLVQVLSNPPDEARICPVSNSAGGP